MARPSRGELPIIQACIDLIRWTIPLLNGLPRAHKFTLGDRIVAGLYDTGRYAHASQRIDGVGRQLAGWLGQQRRQTTSSPSYFAPPAMKPLVDLYPSITSFSNLWAAAQCAQRGKRYRPDVLAFNSRLEAELFRMRSELRAFTYQPGPYRRFQIRDPKPRTISAAAYRDRVVHHALCAVITPPLEHRFVATSYANRKGYGSHRALRRFVSKEVRRRASHER
jgi:hypothetical protein